MIGRGRLCQVHKRESLLSAALDYGLLPFLSACIRQFSAPELVSRGLNLRFLLDWTWKRVAYVKDSIDKLCECQLTVSAFALALQVEALLWSRAVPDGVVCDLVCVCA